MSDIILHKVDDVYLRVECDKSILYDLAERFTFYAPNYKYHPKFKMKIWDGLIRLLNLNTRKLYLGLHTRLYNIATELNYTVEYAPGFFNPSTIVYDKREIANCKFEPRYYQEAAVKFALEKKRCVLLSPTGSGKSYIIYLTLKHIKERTLIIVPTISLVHQLANDFIQYDPKSANWIHKIMAGADKNIKAPLTISTWQSLMNQPQEWFDQFKVVIGDECLTPDTLITMSDGNKKRIDQVIIGDEVKTYNEKLHIIEDKLVKGIHKNISKKESIYELTLSNGNIIKITGNHKVLLTNGEWKRVDNLEVSDIINSIEMVKEGLKVVGIKKIEYNDDVYNLHIEDNHNYFANDINVSNCHSFQATALTKIMEKCKNIEWKIGTTGTLSNADAKVNALILEGLFGEVLPVSTTRTLIDEDHLSDFKIKALLLKYSKEEAKEVRKMNYYNEMTHINTSEKRNKFIANLAISQKNNTLVLFSWVEKHGKPLFELIKEKAGTSKNVYFISGEVKGEERERIRKIVNDSEDNIIVASFQTFSTGIDLPNLHSVIFASSYKSTIKNLQSIGRVLRKHEGKEWATLYDIVDDCSTKTSKNFSVQHFLERVKIYNEAKFPFRIHNIPF